MKILVFNGSPKRERSDTMHITNAFLDGMQDAAAQEITVINTVDAKVLPCTGCLTCMRTGEGCVLQDDMKDILEQILTSDLLIWSFPLYCYGMPATMKAIIDRTLPLSSIRMHRVADRYEHYAQHDFSKLRYIMISGCGFPAFKGNFDGMIAQFYAMFSEADSTVITVPEAPMFNAPEAAVATVPFLKVVRQAGLEYARDGFVAPGTMEKLAVPMIPEDVYVQICNASN